MLLVSTGGTGNYIHRTHHLSRFGGGPEPRRKGRRRDRDRKEKRDKGIREEWDGDRKEGM